MDMTNPEKQMRKGGTLSVLLPQRLLHLLDSLPANVDRRFGAHLVTKHFFRVSHRTLEAWPLPVQHVNGRAVTSTYTLFEVAHAKLTAAPIIMSGRSNR